jgi:hypothetical protein
MVSLDSREDVDEQRELDSNDYFTFDLFMYLSPIIIHLPVINNLAHFSSSG